METFVFMCMIFMDSERFRETERGSLTLKLSFWNHDVCRRSYSNALTNVDRKIRNMNVALCKTLLELGSFIDF